jgi:hypothetical protein
VGVPEKFITFINIITFAKFAIFAMFANFDPAPDTRRGLNVRRRMVHPCQSAPSQRHIPPLPAPMGEGIRG